MSSGLVFVFRMFRVDAAVRRAARLPLIVAAVLVGGLLSLAGGSGLLPGPSDVWNLAVGFIPLALAAALMSYDAP